ncbi:hypothetical protein AV530_014895 [Patagioenas fasciata monilis]|uniref:Uncharacterized protein n=1 Tax=Patagioenas fasciata monilis TaxID=372326 RepID=A0A1V4K3C7_PATFA|nr:hypothetical protein AV530_014895 [Patagioenas fasciata monilis]
MSPGVTQIVLVDDLATPVGEGGSHEGLPTPVNLDLKWVLGHVPQKEFALQRVSPTLRPLSLPPALALGTALDRVLRLPAVASKRWLTNKVGPRVTSVSSRCHLGLPMSPHVIPYPPVPSMSCVTHVPSPTMTSKR